MLWAQYLNSTPVHGLIWLLFMSRINLGGGGSLSDWREEKQAA